MDHNAATDVIDVEDLDHDRLIHAIEEHFKGSHCPELEKTGFAEDCSI